MTTYLLLDTHGQGTAAHTGSVPEEQHIEVPEDKVALATEQPYNFFKVEDALVYLAFKQPTPDHFLIGGVYTIPVRVIDRGAVWAGVKELRTDYQHGGVHVGGNWFHSDTNSRIQFLGLTIMGANIPAGLQWKTMDGTFVTMTGSLASQIFQATAAHDIACHAVAEVHKVNLYATPLSYQYDYSEGWPTIWKP